jgi:hypothetical protein
MPDVNPMYVTEWGDGDRGVLVHGGRPAGGAAAFAPRTTGGERIVDPATDHSVQHAGDRAKPPLARCRVAAQERMRAFNRGEDIQDERDGA